MRITSVTASRSIKVNTGNYESRDAFFSVSAEPDPGEGYYEVFEYTQALAQREIKKIERIIRTGDDDMKVSDLMNRPAAIPQVGTIRKGGARGTSKKGAFKGGDDLPHFRVEFTDDEARKYFESIYGSEPTKINVRLPYQDVWRNWKIAFEAYNITNNLQFSADGDEADSVVLYCADDPNRVGTFYRPGVDPELKTTARLSVIVPAIQRASMMVFTTTSIYDITRITDALKYYFTEDGMNMPANRVPLILYRSPEEVAVRYQGRDGGKVRSRKTYSLVKLEIDPAWARQMLARSEQEAYALVGGQAPKVLELNAGDLEGYEVDTETGEIIDAAPHNALLTGGEKTKPAWHEDQSVLNRFYSFCYGLDMSKDEIFIALGIEETGWSAYRGSAKDAKRAVDTYVAQRDEANAQPEQPTLIDAPPARNPNNPADWD